MFFDNFSTNMLNFKKFLFIKEKSLGIPYLIMLHNTLTSYKMGIDRQTLCEEY
jgi:hypothetical protein